MDLKSIEIAGAYKKVGESFKRDLIGTSDYIRTFAIITAENPRVSVKDGDSWVLKPIEMSPHENNRRNGELESLLKRGKYVFRTVAGRYGGLEHPFMILNITLSAAKQLAAVYDQESFIFAERIRPNAADGTRSSNMRYAYFVVRGDHKPAKMKELKRTDSNGFVVDTMAIGVRDGDMYAAADSKNSVEQDSEAVDFYSRKGDFKFSIPFTKFNVAEAIELYRRREQLLGSERFEKLLTESLVEEKVGKFSLFRRTELLEGA